MLTARENLPLDVEQACAEIHRLLQPLPTFHSPNDFSERASFRNGVYFFYESGEVSDHGSEGRIVRIGNHPRAASGLVRRLANHYRSSVGAKNGSVFRRYLGGALLRRDRPDAPCLQPAPGEGHWEKQHQAACMSCGDYERRVSELLSESFTFKCVAVLDRDERNELEKALIATIAACSVCKASPAWLGQLAFGGKIRDSGLWNSDGVGGPTLTEQDLKKFRLIVGGTNALE